MIRVTDWIWIGDSHDAAEADLKAPRIGAILNCAHDLQIDRGWTEGIEYAQCGLVDGPGNPVSAYYAAMFKLVALSTGGRSVLVHDHEAGSRAVAVVIMALHALHRRGWDHWLGVVREKLEAPDFEPHPEHRRAFDRINWRLVAAALEG